MSTFYAKGRNYSMGGTIYDSRIDDMAADWVQKKARETSVLAKANLTARGKGYRTGALYRSIHPTRRRAAAGHITVRVVAGAGHASFVHQGTHGPIHAIGGRAGPYGNMMWVPRSKGSTRRVWMHEVRGQQANPFLAAAMQEVLIGTRSPFRLP